MGKKHWGEYPSPCICGKTFRSYAAEARHRHNFPLFCITSPTGRFPTRPELQFIKPPIAPKPKA